MLDFQISRTEILHTFLQTAIVVFICFLAFFGIDIVFGLSLFFTPEGAGSDLWHVHYPIKHFYQEELQAGRLPFWSEQLGFGYPLFAEGQVAALYPINLFLYYLFPFALAFNWSIIISFVLCGAFTSILARQIGAGKLSSTFAGVVFAFSAFMVLHLKHINMIAAASWMPFMMFLALRMAYQINYLKVSLLTLAIAVCFLAGHPQIAYNNSIMLLVFSVLVSLAVWNRKGSKSALSYLLSIYIALQLGILIAAPQLLMTKELNSYGPRKDGFSIEEATQWEYKHDYLLTFLKADWFGATGKQVANKATASVSGDGRGVEMWDIRGFELQDAIYWEIVAYVGVLPLALLLLGILRIRYNTTVQIFVVFIAFALLIVFGKQAYFFNLLWEFLPGFNLFRFHSRFLFYVALGIIVLAALNLSTIRLAEQKKNILIIICIIAGFIDLYYYLHKHNLKIPTKEWLKPPEVVKTLDNERAVSFYHNNVFRNSYLLSAGRSDHLATYNPIRNVMGPNSNLLYGVSNVDTYFQLYPTWMKEISGMLYFPMIYQQIASLFAIKHTIMPVYQDFAYWQHKRKADPLAETIKQNKVVASFNADNQVIKVNSASGKEAYAIGPEYRINVFENTDIYPRFFFISKARLVDEKSGFEILLKNQINFKEEVLLYDQEILTNESLVNQKDPNSLIQLRLNEQQRVEFLTETNHPQWLFFSDTYYPGWRATVNGRLTKIYRANHAGRAIFVPAGRHKIVFEYIPKRFHLGMKVSCFILVLLLLGWLVQIFSGRRSRG